MSNKKIDLIKQQQEELQGNNQDMNESSNLNEKLIQEEEPQINQVQQSLNIKQNNLSSTQNNNNNQNINLNQVPQDADAEKAFLQNGQESQQQVQQKIKKNIKSNNNKNIVNNNRSFKEDDLFKKQEKQFITNNGDDDNDNNNNKDNEENEENQQIYQKINPFLNKTPEQVYKDDLLSQLVLPPTKRFDFRKANNQIKQMDNVPQVIKSQINNIGSFLDEYLETWDVSYNSNVKFGLPETAFDGTTPVIQYQQPTYEVEKLELGVLTKEQFNSIWKTGSFEVPSKKFSTPYTWRLNTCLIKGRDNINESWRCDMGRLFTLYGSWKLLFYNKRNKDNYIDDLTERYATDTFCQPEVVDSIKEVFWRFPKRLFNLFLGHKWENITNNYNQINPKLEESRNIFAINSKNFNEQLIDFTLQSPDTLNKKAQIIWLFNKLEIQFLYEEWEPKLLEFYKKDLNENDAEYENQLEDFRQAAFHKYVEEKYPKQEINDNIITNEQISSVLNYIKAYRIITKYNDQYERKVTEYEIDLRTNIQKKHSIKSKDYRWLQEQEEILKIKNRKEQQKIREQLIIQDFQQQKLNSQLHVYSLFLEFEKNYNNNKKKIKKSLSKQTSTSDKTFYVQFEKIFPNIIYDKKTNIYRNEQYYEKYIESKYYFWRLKLFYYRCKSLIIMLTEGCFYLAFCSAVSFKAIFYCKEFSTKKQLKDNTSKELIPCKYSKEKPIKMLFSDLLEEIKRDRKRFEDIPDTAFFGKSTSRFCNIVKNYLFILFFFGIIGLLILYPILLLVLDFLLIALGMVLWAIIPVTLIVGVVIQWVFFDWDKTVDSYHAKHTFGLYLFPLITIVLKLVYKGCFQLAWAVSFIFGILPVVFILMFLFSVFRYICRSIYDFFTFGIIKCSARTPVREDNMARRIKGPGVEKNRSYYYTIEDEDVFMLIRAELEKLQLIEYESRVKRIIQKPLKKAKQIYADCLEYFNIYRIDSFNEIVQDQSIFMQKLQSAINSRKQSFPAFQSQQVRFNDGELERLIPITTEIIYGYINQTNLKNFIWRQLKVKKDDYEALSDKIWKRIFQNENILEALSEEDEIYRHEIQKVKRKSINYLQDLDVDLKQENVTKWNRSGLSKSKRKFNKKQEKILSYQVQNFSGGKNNIEIQKMLETGISSKKGVLGSIASSQPQQRRLQDDWSNNIKGKKNKMQRKLSMDSLINEDDEYLEDQMNNQDQFYNENFIAQQQIQNNVQQDDYNHVSSAASSDCDYRIQKNKNNKSQTQVPQSLNLNQTNNQRNIQQNIQVQQQQQQSQQIDINVQQQDQQVINIQNEFQQEVQQVQPQIQQQQNAKSSYQSLEIEQIQIENDKNSEGSSFFEEEEQKEQVKIEKEKKDSKKIQSNSNNTNQNKNQDYFEFEKIQKLREDPKYVEIENKVNRNGPTKIAKLNILFDMVNSSIAKPRDHDIYYALKAREYAMFLNKNILEEQKNLKEQSQNKK